MSYLENLYLTDEEFTFDIKNLDKSILNALRRIMISEVPTIAFNTNYGKETDIVIEENTSSLHNEFLSHRLSLLPINIPYKNIEDYDRNKYEFILDITNNTSKIIDVTTEHIQIKEINSNKFLSKEECKKIFPPSKITKDYILINKLKPNTSSVEGKGECMKIKMYASKSIGKEHSRYTPTCVSIFINKRDENKNMYQLH